MSKENSSDSLKHAELSTTYMRKESGGEPRFSRNCTPTAVNAFTAHLKTGRQWSLTSPLTERIAQKYAENILSSSPMNKRQFEQAMSKELNTTEPQVRSVISRKEFPAVLHKYVPVESVTQRHMELMNQDSDLKVAADMVKLGYKVHRVDGEDGKKPAFANFLQQINNYGGEGTPEKSSRPDVEIVEPVQNQEQGRENHNVQAE